MDWGQEGYRVAKGEGEGDHVAKEEGSSGKGRGCDGGGRGGSDGGSYGGVMVVVAEVEVAVVAV